MRSMIHAKFLGVISLQTLKDVNEVGPVNKEGKK